MRSNDISQTIKHTVEDLSEHDSLKKFFIHRQRETPPPSQYALQEITNLCRSILFPGYFGTPKAGTGTMKYHIGVALERLYELLSEQIMAGKCFINSYVEHKQNISFTQNQVSKQINSDPFDDSQSINEIQERCDQITTQLIKSLPQIREKLITDVEATYNGDPAAESYGEVISCYPVIKALTNYRVAHKLHLLNVPLIPRALTETAHSETGIDIHPAAEIGHHFTIDHGTGVVIGETCIIGNYVKLYQGVTLGARSFPLDDKGNPIKGIPRHPIIEDNVIIYSNSTILGRITIGHDSIIGGNIWVTESVKPGSKIYRRFENS